MLLLNDNQGLRRTKLNITDKLYIYLKKQNIARSDKWLARNLKLKVRDIAVSLEELEDSGRIYRTELGEYRAVNEKYVYSGRVVLTPSGRAYVWLSDGRELPLEMPRKVAFAGEEVKVFIPKGDQQTAILIEVPSELPGGGNKLELSTTVSDVDLPLLYRAGNEREIHYLLSPMGNIRRLFRCVISGLNTELKQGDIVRVRIIGRPMHGDMVHAELVHLEQSGSTLKVYEDALEERYGLDVEKPQPDETQLSMFARLQAQSMANPNRRDLRNDVCFTIDGDAAKDFDDAVSLHEKDDYVLLGVHIADVSNFVRTGMQTDNEAYARGTSVYLPWRTFHMLPEVLSCNLCSLMPDIDRLTITCQMKIKQGKVFDYEIFPSIIHSNARLTYNEVNKLLSGEQNAVPEELHNVLKGMRKLADELAKVRHARGAISFESHEVEFILDNAGIPKELVKREQGSAEKLIEEFMLLANECVAAHMQKNGLGCVYRVHEKPSRDDVAHLEKLATNLGIKWRAGNMPEPRAFQRLIEMSEDIPGKVLLQTAALRSMTKARYSEKPLGHFGLALQDYCHFTSPIRRYPDLIVHRLLHFEFDGRTDSGSCHRLQQELPARAANCSACELNAATAEREADNLLKCAYMSAHEGEEFEGTLSGMSSWAIFVTLDNYCEGAVPLRTLDEYYTADESMTRMVSDSGNILEMGTRVKVCIDSVSLTEPRVYLLLTYVF